MLGNFLYRDRLHAGKVLSEIILKRELINPIILALPRGGVPIGMQIAEVLKAPLDVLIVRKIGAPFNPEYGIGAISEDLIPLMSAESLVNEEHLEEEVKEIIENEKKELIRRIQLYRGDRKLPEFQNRTVILVDDGIATGVTAAAAGKFLKSQGAKEVILAVPVGPRTLGPLVRRNVDEIICPYTPAGFSGVGSWYQDFRQVSDEEVVYILNHFYPSSSKQFRDIHL